MRYVIPSLKEIYLNRGNGTSSVFCLNKFKSFKVFNVKTGTLFENTKIPLQKWFISIWLITSHKKGISSLQLSKDINVTQKTGWFILQRIRKCFEEENIRIQQKTFGDFLKEVYQVYITTHQRNTYRCILMNLYLDTTPTTKLLSEI